jgi:hypothetical protein
LICMQKFVWTLVKHLELFERVLFDFDIVLVLQNFFLPPVYFR